MASREVGPGHSPPFSENFGFKVRFNAHDLKEVRFVLRPLAVEVLIRIRAHAFQRFACEESFVEEMLFCVNSRRRDAFTTSPMKSL